MSISSCPTPTVSMRTCLFPAASSSSATSAVARASPPRNPRVAIERMKVPESPACPCMRIRSPRMAPPEYGLVGSTAITPTCSRFFLWYAAKRSTRVLFPVPGAPVTPVRYACPVCGNSSRSNSSASGAWFSIAVIARDTARTSPVRTCSAHFSMAAVGALGTVTVVLWSSSERQNALAYYFLPRS